MEHLRGKNMTQTAHDGDLVKAMKQLKSALRKICGLHYWGIVGDRLLNCHNVYTATLCPLFRNGKCQLNEYPRRKSFTLLAITTQPDEMLSIEI